MFLGANTPDGFVHHFDKVIEMWGLRKLYILKGGNGIGKSVFMRKFAESFDGDVVYLYCASDPKSLDGVIIESAGIGIVDGTFPHMIDPKYPGIVDQIVNLGDFIIPEKVKITQGEINNIAEAKRKLYRTAYDCLERARQLHYKLEKCYSAAVDFDAVNALCNKLITSAKLDAGVINRNSRRENSTK